MIGTSDEITTLNTLTTTLIDSVNGYRDAASNSESGRFQELFRTNADERSRVVEELRSEVRRLGGNPEDDASTLGPRSSAATRRSSSTRSSAARTI